MISIHEWGVFLFNLLPLRRINAALLGKYLVIVDFLDPDRGGKLVSGGGSWINYSIINMTRILDLILKKFLRFPPPETSLPPLSGSRKSTITRYLPSSAALILLRGRRLKRKTPHS
jgi:hypothetical protein